MPFLLEICCDTIASAITAAQHGADRLELCDNLSAGGVTPSAGSILIAKRKLYIPVFVLVRPRPGDFCYSEDELAIMLADIAEAKKLGADGIVSGALLPDGRIDRAATARLIAAADGLPFTFHRAFDHCADPLLAWDELRSLGAHRILTSGQGATVAAGRDMLLQLGAQSLVSPPHILVGGGLRADNAHLFAGAAGLAEFHSSARYAQPRLDAAGYASHPVDGAEVQRLRAVLDEMSRERG